MRGMSKSEVNSLSETDTASGKSEAASALASLGAEIVDLLYTQTFAPGDEGRTEREVCEAFAEVLLRHWELCCIIVFLRDENGRLSERALKIHEHAHEATARRVSALFAAEVERDGREKQAWTKEDAAGFTSSPEHMVTEETRRALSKTELGAGVAVPIHARGNLVGALVVLTTSPEPLRAAHKGLPRSSSPSATRAAPLPCASSANISNI